MSISRLITKSREDLNNIAAVEQEDTKTKEETVRGLILNISM